jgi:hypothetical protein
MNSATISLLFLLSSFSTVSSSQLFHSISEFKFDESNRLSQHYLLYTGSCGRVPQIQYDRREVVGAEGELKSVFFPDSSSESCHMVCLEKGTSVDYIKYPLPILVYPKKPTETGEVEAVGEQDEDFIINDPVSW